MSPYSYIEYLLEKLPVAVNEFTDVLDSLDVTFDTTGGSANVLDELVLPNKLVGILEQFLPWSESLPDSCKVSVKNNSQLSINTL